MAPARGTAMRRHQRRRVAAALIGAIGLTVSAVEADDKVYLRAGVGIDHPGNVRFLDTDCATTSPTALYGCGMGPDGARHQSLGTLGTVPAVEVGLGYAAAPAVRIEGFVEYRPRLDFEGQANFLAPEREQSVTAEVSSLAGLVAAFLDLPELGLSRIGPFGPFVGAGVGATRNRIGETHMRFPRTTTIVPGADHVDIAWMVTAGLATALGEDLTLDVAWRYTDAGAVRTGQGAGRVVWRDGSREPLPLDLAPTRATQASHGLRLSLRYAF